MTKNIKKDLFNILTYIFLIVWIIGASSLVYSEFTIWDICPKLLWIPACYIIFLFFLLLLFIHILKLKKRYFYIVISIPLSIALYWTIFQIIWTVECPKTEEWIPLCFISLFLFFGAFISIRS